MSRHLISAVLAAYRDEDGATFWHWCPECKDLHPLPPTWKFDGNLEKPTFTPSFRQFPGDPKRECHYNITNGMIVWHGDNIHSRKSGSEPMVPLTPEMLDMP